MQTSTTRWLSAGLVGVFICAVHIASLAQTSAAGIARFTGTWKEDASKRSFGSVTELRFQRNAKGGLEEVRGPEVRPVFQPIIFDGKPHKLETGNNSIAWTQPSPNSFQRVLSDGTRTLTTRRIRISTDGKSMTEDTESKTTDGRTSVDTIVYQRVLGDGQALVGRWKAVSYKTDHSLMLKIESVGTNGLKIMSGDRDLSQTATVMLDGKPVPVTGAAVISGTMMAARAVDDRTIELTDSREGVESGKAVWQLSPDGKTLTAKITTAGSNASGEPGIAVYVKQ